MITLLTACSANPPVPDESGEERDYRSVEGEPEEEEPEPDGSADAAGDGGSEEAAADRLTRRQMMRLAGRYQRRLVKAIGQQWEPPELPAERLATLGDQAVVYIRLDADGQITSFEFRQKSQSTEFDESIRRCLNSFTDEGGGQTLPLPEHPEVRRAIIKRGINLQRWRDE